MGPGKGFKPLVLLNPKGLSGEEGVDSLLRARPMADRDVECQGLGRFALEVEAEAALLIEIGLIPSFDHAAILREGMDIVNTRSLFSWRLRQSIDTRRFSLIC